MLGRGNHAQEGETELARRNLYLNALHVTKLLCMVRSNYNLKVAKINLGRILLRYTWRIKISRSMCSNAAICIQDWDR